MRYLLLGRVLNRNYEMQNILPLLDSGYQMFQQLVYINQLLSMSAVAMYVHPTARIHLFLRLIAIAMYWTGKLAYEAFTRLHSFGYT